MDGREEVWHHSYTSRNQSAVKKCSCNELHGAPYRVKAVRSKTIGDLTLMLNCW